MALPFVFNNNAYPAAFFASINFNTGSQTATVSSLSPSNYYFNGTINQAGDSISYSNSATGPAQGNLYATNYDDAGHLLLRLSSPTTGGYYIISNSQLTNGQSITFTEAQLGQYQVLCFVTGTRIRVLREGAEADVPVEDLRVGDLAVTASGGRRPIRWIGSRSLDLRRCPDQAAAQPFRIARDAFAPGRPARDLFVSPGHALCVDVLGEVLIPTFCLANGATVRQVERDQVTYWHIELDAHDVLLAEGLPAESYLDAGDRAFFAASGTTSPPAGLEASPGRCRPFTGDGALVDVVRARLSERARLLGWEKSADMDIHLLVDGRRVEPVRAEGLVRFTVPGDATDVELRTAWFQPVWTGLRDARRLGIAVTAIRVSDGLHLNQEIRVDDERLARGFHAAEFKDAYCWRYTDGSARLPGGLWSGAAGDVFLTIAFNPAASERWLRPAAEADEERAATNVVRLRAEAA